MNWQDLFNKSILSRGRQYFREGKVTITDESEKSVRAKVRSSDRRTNYLVEFTIDGEELSVYCSCPYAASNHKCKHMAAVLFEDEAFGKFKHFESIKDRKVANPFAKKSQQEYTHFQLAAITSDMIFTESAVRKGKAIFSNENITIDDIDVGYGKFFLDNEQNCNISGIYTAETGHYDVKISFDRHSLNFMECKAPGCKCTYTRYNYYFENRNKPCEHVTALLLEFEEYQKNHIVGDATDRDGMKAIKLFRKFSANKTIVKEENRQIVHKISLEPKLIMEKNQLKLQFKIGEKKLYAIRNYVELVDAVRYGRTIDLGKTSSINFDMATFTESSQIYMDYIIREVMQELYHKEKIQEALSGKWYETDAKTDLVGNSLLLYGRRLDEFYDLFSESRIPFLNKDAGSKEKYIGFVEANPKVSLNISEEYNDEQLSNIRVQGKVPNVIEGIKCKYFLKDDAFCRINEQDAKKMRPIWELAKDGEINFAVGRKYIPEFYYSILPELEDMAEIETNVGDAVRNLLPDEVDFSFYLDAEDNYLICNPIAKYEKGRLSVIDFLDEDSIPEAFRDEFKENEIIEAVMKYFPNIDSKRMVFYCDKDNDAVFAVLEKGISALMELGHVHCTDSFKSRNTKRSMKISVGVSIVSDLMNLEISSEGISSKELLEILYSYRLKKKYHRLSNGDFVDIEDESLGELNAMIDAMHISPKEFAKGKMKFPLYRALYLDKMLESCEEIYATRDKYFKSLVKEFKTIKDSDFEVPNTFSKVLRNYQQYGYKWIKSLAVNNFAGILADDMGLGKTLQMISVIADSQEVSNLPSLIVCPASLIYNWQSEFEKFAPKLKLLLVVGNQFERKEIISSAIEYDVVITSYDLLKRDIADYEDISFEYQVIDEAQYIKTHTTAAAKSVKAIKAKHKMALTGTPIENRLSELWSIFDYLMPGFLYSYDVFKKEIENPIVKGKDPEATKRLKRMVAPFILRRLKQDVLKDLPDKIEEHRYAKMDDEQQKLYDAQVTHMRAMLENEDSVSFKKNKIQILAELMRIRQICCDPSLMLEDYVGESAKREACIELIRSAIEGEHKMLIFSQFTSMLDLLAKDLDDLGICYYTITGQTPKEKRIAMVNSFNEDNIPVFLISLKAGGTGLNLTGADVVIHYDPWWNIAAQNQATDRAHRIGQNKIVTVYKLIVKDSIEDKIVQMQKDKEELANEILSGENGIFSSMKKEDLLDLIR